MLRLCLVAAAIAVTAALTTTLESTEGISLGVPPGVDAIEYPIVASFPEEVSGVDGKQVQLVVLPASRAKYFALSAFELTSVDSALPQKYTAHLKVTGAKDIAASVYIILRRGATSSSANPDEVADEAMLTLVYSTEPLGGVQYANEVSYTGYSNKESISFLVNFAQEVQGFGSESPYYYGTDGLECGEVQLEEANVQRGLYRITVPGCTGEGTLIVAINNTVTDMKGNVVDTADKITMIRDVTPPTVVVSSDDGVPGKDEDGNDIITITQDSYIAKFEYSEGIDEFGLSDIRFLTYGLGGAGLSPLQSLNESSFTAEVGSITTSWDMRPEEEKENNSLTVTLAVKPSSVVDLAGNVGPVDGSNTLIVRAVLPPPTPSPTPEPKSNNLSTILLIVLIVLLIVVIVGMVIMYQKQSKSSQSGFSAIPSHPATDFMEHADAVFNEYRGPNPEEEDVVTFEQIVNFTVQRGFPKEMSELAAKSLLKEAVPKEGGSADRMTREEWQQWLIAKVAKGGEPTAEQVRELRRVFPVKR